LSRSAVGRATTSFWKLIADNFHRHGVTELTGPPLVIAATKSLALEPFMRAGLPISSLGSLQASSTSAFTRLAGQTAYYTGKPITFVLAAVVIVAWAAMGPIFHFSDTWQLVVNTGTTIVTFLMVFLIQNTQNRDTLALQLKLDELIIATKEARNSIAGVEDLTQEELEMVKDAVVASAQKRPAKKNGARRRA
jgi:low affinity Fe/Cu permease